LPRHHHQPAGAFGRCKQLKHLQQPWHTAIPSRPQARQIKRLLSTAGAALRLLRLRRAFHGACASCKTRQVAALHVLRTLGSVGCRHQTCGYWPNHTAGCFAQRNKGGAEGGGHSRRKAASGPGLCGVNLSWFNAAHTATAYPAAFRPSAA
jgi:hypothetical protein